MRTFRLRTLLAGHAEERQASGLALSVAAPCSSVNADRLGLAIIMMKAMERKRRRVWAESEPGRSATICLEFPAKATSP